LLITGRARRQEDIIILIAKFWDFTKVFKKHSMDIPALKLDVVQKILNTKNPSLLFKINNISKKEVEKDWWDQLPREVQDSIYEGIRDIEEGKVFTHDQVIQEAKQKYGF
jgi:hypothetical protein